MKSIDRQLTRQFSIHRGSAAAAGCRSQRGMSMVEMMITVLLGLIVVAAVFNIYAGTSRSSQFTSGLQSMQENGRFGVAVLQKSLRLAGYSPTQRLPAFDLDPARAGENTVVIRLNQAYDCNGESTADSDGVAINTFRHDAAGERITCEGNSAAASEMTIVEGVEEFRVLYGVDLDNDEVPDRYVPFTDSDLQADRISALRFALLVSSPDPIRSRNVDESHVVLDRVYAKNDRKARSVFASTVKLRNRR